MITENQPVHLPILSQKNIQLFVKREDTIHPFVSGNKYRKLKYNIQQALAENATTVITFGGAFSNHIAATAFAAKQHNLQSIGVIRGEEMLHKWHENPTLQQAHAHGMAFVFVSREVYRNKEADDFITTHCTVQGSYFVIPEGGTNELAVKGCEEILQPEDQFFDIITTCVGTGGTIAGLINSLSSQQSVLGFPALKGDFLQKDIRKFAENNRWQLCCDYHFGGYAKVSVELIEFMNDFKKQTQIPLDPVYTAKMMFGLLDLVARDFFKSGTRILAIHTGGLQGIAGMNKRLEGKQIPQIE